MQSTLKKVLQLSIIVYCTSTKLACHPVTRRHDLTRRSSSNSSPFSLSYHSNVRPIAYPFIPHSFLYQYPSLSLSLISHIIIHPSSQGQSTPNNTHNQRQETTSHTQIPRQIRPIQLITRPPRPLTNNSSCQSHGGHGTERITNEKGEGSTPRGDGYGGCEGGSSVP